MAKRFYELKGNPKYTSPEAVNKIVKNFLDVATDPRRTEHSVWITRSQGMGKDETFWGKARPGIWTQGATDTQAEFDEKKTKGKLRSSPHLRRPHTDLGSIIYHTAREYNTRLKQKLVSQGLPEPQIQSQLAQRAIKVRPMLISASQTKQYGRKVASEIREKAIEGLGKRQVITFTRSGDIEGKHERGARQLYENMQEARKDSGFKSKGASDKITDQFIDEVNVEIDGKPKYNQNFKEGAYKFLLNKEADWHFSTDVDERLLTDQRLQDMRTWTRGSNIQAVGNLALPKYIQKQGDIGTTFVGQTEVYAETIHGPDLPENLELTKPVAAGDYAFASDYLTEDFPDDKKVASIVTTSGDELGSAHTDPTIKETKTYSTRGGTWGWEDSRQATVWKDYPGQIYWSEQIDTKIRESELVASSKPVRTPVSSISSSYADVMAAAQHKGTTDAVSELVYGFVDDIGEEVGGFEDDPKHGSGYGTHDVTQANERDIKERKVMENIEYAHQKGGWGQYVYWRGVNKGLSIETPQVMKGVKEVTATDRGVYQPDESKPVYEDIWGQSSEDTSKLPHEKTTTVKASDMLTGERVGGEKTVINQGDVDANLKVVGQKKVFARHYPTIAEKERQARLSEMTPVQAMEAKKEYVEFRNQKIKEYNLRMQQGTHQSFIHGLKMKNRNQLHKAPVEATGRTMANPAAQMLNPSGKTPDPYRDKVPVSQEKIAMSDAHPQMGADELLMDDQYEEMKANNARIEAARAKTPEVKIPQFKPGDVLTYSNSSWGEGGTYYDIVVSKGENIHGINVVYSKATEQQRRGWQSTEVSTGRYLFSGATRKEVITATQKHFGDPKNVEKALTVIKEVRKKNVTTGAGPSPETIELFKSRVTGEYMTKGKVKKTAVKQLGKNVGKTIRGPVGGSTLGIFSMLLAPIGAAGDVIRHEKAIREEKAMKHPPYRRKKSGWSMLLGAKDGTYGSALLNRMAPEEMGGPFPSLANKRNKYKSHLWQ